MGIAWDSFGNCLGMGWEWCGIVWELLGKWLGFVRELFEFENGLRLGAFGELFRICAGFGVLLCIARWRAERSGASPLGARKSIENSARHVSYSHFVYTL